LPWKWTLCILRQNPNLIFFHCPVRITNSFSLVGKNQNPSRFLSLDSLQGSKCNALRFNMYVFLLEKHRSLFFLYSVSSKFQSLEQVFMAPLLWSTWATTCGLAFWERDAHLISLDDLHLSYYLGILSYRLWPFKDPIFIYHYNYTSTTAKVSWPPYLLYESFLSLYLKFSKDTEKILDRKTNVTPLFFNPR
jgi:hypothetical protein